MSGRRVAPFALALIAMGCTHDFDALTVGSDGGTVVSGDATTTPDTTSVADAPLPPNDTTPAVDTAAPIDTGCTPLPDPTKACTDTAVSCTAACRATTTTCKAACDNPGCRKKCDDAEVTCRSDCEAKCRACTKTAGCEAGPQCVAAVK